MIDHLGEILLLVAFAAIQATISIKYDGGMQVAALVAAGFILLPAVLLLLKDIARYRDSEGA